MPQIREDVAALLANDKNIDVAVSYLTLARGSKGDAVVRLQKALMEKGYDLGKWGADGDYGSATSAAVLAFQVDNGLAATGVANNDTLTVLYQEQQLYTAVIKHLNQIKLNKLTSEWENVEVIKE